jgi:2-oxoglutarate dehydrogenase E1 component
LCTIHKKFPGQKRFSLEGAEALIPALDAIMEKGSQLGTNEFVIGMPHRGRLNVLVNILKKPYRDIFSEFKGMTYDDEALLGDVKYHLGHTVERLTTQGKKVRLTLSPNPSHLESDPVVGADCRARADQDYKGDFNRIAAILIHGDASIAGQGVVYEVIQMSQLQGYKTGGTIHVVVNNQLGFTTNYLDARSSTYCTDVAKVVQSPVFHVNGDDVGAKVGYYSARYGVSCQVPAGCIPGHTLLPEMAIMKATSPVSPAPSIIFRKASEPDGDLPAAIACKRAAGILVL